MEKIMEDLFPTGTVHEKLQWYDTLIQRYHEFEWPSEYPPLLCTSIFKDILTLLRTTQYTSSEWLHYMNVLDRIQYTSESHIRACVQSMLDNTHGISTLTRVHTKDVRDFIERYPDRDNVPLLRFFVLNTLTHDVYKRLVLYTIKNEIPIRCYLQSMTSTPTVRMVTECSIDYEDPAFELDLLYLAKA